LGCEHLGEPIIQWDSLSRLYNSFIRLKKGGRGVSPSVMGTQMYLACLGESGSNFQ
jgi:hypothetical protein